MFFFYKKATFFLQKIWMLKLQLKNLVASSLSTFQFENKSSRGLEVCVYGLCYGFDSFYLLLFLHGQYRCNFPNLEVLELRRKVDGRLVTSLIRSSAIYHFATFQNLRSKILEV